LHGLSKYRAKALFLISLNEDGACRLSLHAQKRRALSIFLTSTKGQPFGAWIAHTPTGTFKRELFAQAVCTMSDYTSGSITFTGLSSGTDWTTIIEQLVEVEGAHKTQMEEWATDWTDKIDALEALNEAMSDLRTTLLSMSTLSSFASMSVESSDTDVVTATATTEAEQTTHDIEVQQLAKNSIWMSANGVSSTTTALNMTESFSYSYNDPNASGGSSVISVDVTGDTTLDGLVTAINDDPDNPGVKATIINDGSNNYLQIRGLDLGSDANLDIYTPSVGDLGAFTETQANQDAHVKVDGWPADENTWIRSSSNTIATAIPGVTLSLKDVGDSQITIAADTEEMQSNIEEFVDAYNEVLALFQEATKVDTSATETTDSETTGANGSVLTGNYGVQLVASNLKTSMSSLAPGFVYYDSEDNSGDFYTSLGQIGITTDADESSDTYGLLVIDDDTLEAALASDSSSVAMLFAADGIGGVVNDGGSANFSYSSYIEGISTPGTYDVQYTVNADGTIASATIGGEECSIDNTNGLITCTDGLAKGIAIKVNNRSTGTYTGEVNLKQGKIGELCDMLEDYTNETTGQLNIIIDNYEDIVNNIADKIDYEEDRLDRMATSLTQKYARLEATLSEYEGIQSTLTSAIDSLSSD
jgi:flagellar hook-associated protein 2